MNNQSKLMQHLPRYYQNSTLMNTLMKAFEIEFSNEQLDFFLEELNKDTIKWDGILNNELLSTLPIDSLETYTLTPEAGVMLSGDDGYLVDGKYYGPLIVDLILTPDNLELAREVVKRNGVSGLYYWYSMMVQHYSINKKAKTYQNRVLIPFSTIPNPSKTISGERTHFDAENTITIQRHIDAKRLSPIWLPPLVKLALYPHMVTANFSEEISGKHIDMSNRKVTDEDFVDQWFRIALLFSESIVNRKAISKHELSYVVNQKFTTKSIKVTRGSVLHTGPIFVDSRRKPWLSPMVRLTDDVKLTDELLFIQLSNSSKGVPVIVTTRQSQLHKAVTTVLQMSGNNDKSIVMNVLSSEIPTNVVNEISKTNKDLTVNLPIKVVNKISKTDKTFSISTPVQVKNIDSKTNKVISMHFASSSKSTKKIELSPLISLLDDIHLTDDVTNKQLGSVIQIKEA